MNLGLRGEGTRGGEDSSLIVQVFCNELKETEKDIDLLITGNDNLAQIKIWISFYYVSIGEKSCKGQ